MAAVRPAALPSHTGGPVPYGSAMKRTAHFRVVQAPAALSAAALMLVALGCGRDGVDVSAPDEAGLAVASEADGLNGPALEAAPGRPPEPRRSREALEASLQRAPSDLPMELDPGLIHEGDPAAFPGAVTIGGQAVRILREYHPDTGGLMRIYTALAEREGDGGRPILHGPEWSYFETGAQSALSWWKEGVLHGPVKQWRPVGTLKFERLYVNGERDGLSRAYSKAGRLVAEEIFDEGQRDGPLREWFASGKLKEEAEYVHGKRQGARKLYTRSGMTMRSEMYVDGELHGPWSDFHGDSGVAKSYGSFEMGQRVGRWEEATEAGTVVASREYAAGELHGTTRIWAVDGVLIEEAVYHEGRKTGPARTWYSSGSAQSEGRFEGGARHGRWIYWRKDGALNEAWSGLYEDDVRVAPLDASDPALEDS